MWYDGVADVLDDDSCDSWSMLLYVASPWKHNGHSIKGNRYPSHI